MKPAGAWLVCYDIANPRRLGRVHRATTRFAVGVQYSVYWARLERPALGAALASLARLINPREDDVRFYPLPENVVTYPLGRAFFPEGICLHAAGLDRLISTEEAPP
jgi:CRISPR-associated protein Cas2